MKFEKKSIRTSTVLWVSFLVIAFDVIFSVYQFVEHYRQWNETRSTYLTQELGFAKKHFEVYKSLPGIVGLMESRRKVNAIEYWILYVDGKLVQTSLNEKQIHAKPEMALTQSPKEPPGLYMPSSDMILAFDQLDARNTLLIGFAHWEGAVFRALIEYWHYRYGLYMGVLIVLVSGLFFFFTNDIIRVTRMMSGRGGMSSRSLSGRSREAEILIRGVESYEDKVHALEKANAALNNQVLPSLKKEILQGKKPPYEFDCTLARVDINNFSQIFNKNNIEEFMGVVDGFFTEATHIIARYRGLVHEFVGDEIIFYIKDEESSNSVVDMVACLNNLGHLAAGISKNTLKEKGYPFTVKASLAHGKIRFGRLVNGFNLAGSSLIETVRILAQVVEKDGNIIVFDTRHSAKLGDLVLSKPYMETQLKGFSGNRNLLRFEQMRPIEEVLSRSVKELVAVQHYRSDDDLAKVLRWCRSQAEIGNFDAAFQSLSQLRLTQITRGGKDLQQQLWDWNEALKSKLITESRTDQKWYKIYASTIKLIENYLPVEDYNEEFEHKLYKLMEVKERRVIANTLDVLTHFKANLDPTYVRGLAQHEDNRVAANALLYEGIDNLKPSVIKGLRRMLESEDPGKMASASWAAGELVTYYKKHDPVYLSTQLAFLNLFEMIRPLANHANDMVQRQARVALAKLDGPERAKSVKSAA